MFSTSENSPFQILSLDLKPSLKSFLDQRESFSVPLDKKAFSLSLLKVLHFLRCKGVVLPHLTPDHIDVLNPREARIRDLEQAHFSESVHQKELSLKESPYMSPEVILGAPRSNKTILWNAAMIIAEVFTRRVIEDFTSLPHLVRSHAQLLDEPYPETLVNRADENGRSYVLASESIETGQKPLNRFMENHAGEEGLLLLDLIKKLLAYEPDQRLSTEEAVHHPFLGAPEELDLPPPKEDIDFTDLSLEEPLGQGAFSSVFRGHYKRKPVAIKCAKKEFIPALLQEDHLLRLFPYSKHVIQRLGIVDMGEDMMGLVLEPMKTNLAAYANEHNGLSLKKTQKFTKQLVNGLIHLALQKTIHLDLKPSNILVSEQGDSVKICDFGMSSINDFLFRPNSLYLQTKSYRSPEILLEIGFNFATDIWSLGVTIAEILIGASIFATDSSEKLYNLHRARLEKEYPDSLIKLAPPDVQVTIREKIKEPRDQRTPLKVKLQTKLEQESPDIALQFQDFIDQMLEYDFQKRPLAKDLSNHPFLKSSFEGPPLKKSKASAEETG